MMIMLTTIRFCFHFIILMSFCLRFQVKAHIDKDCPKSKIPCPFSEFGCTYKVSQIFLMVSLISLYEAFTTVSYY